VIDSAVGREWHVVIANGDLDPAGLGPLPSNVEIHAHVPQLAVLRKASAFVMHGGMGSISEAMYHRVPMVAVPLSANGRPYADRVAELGLGRELEPSEVTADSLWSAIEEVAVDPAVRERLEWMRGELDAAGGGPATADAIEKLLAERV
jgi:MGT family glycosyltransferase